MKLEYAIVVKSKTRLETLIERFNTKAQARFYIENMGGNFEDYESEHEVFQESLSKVQTKLAKQIKNKIVDRRYVPSYMFADNLIVVLGQDGLVANTAKYSNGLPIVGVNPDLTRYDGVLLPFNVGDFEAGIDRVLSGKHESKTVRFAEAQLSDGQRLLGFNDLFIGAKSHVSARYKISFDGRSEYHSSSGLIVSTPAGSTGWLSSIFNMAFNVSGMFNNGLERQYPIIADDQLLFAVREPFKSIRSQTDISTGFVKNTRKLTIESLMPDNGVIFSDGIEQDNLPFNSGTIATIGLSDETATLVTN